MIDNTTALVNQKRLSNIISCLRFPLAIMIVMTHADFEEISMGGVIYVFQLKDYPIFLNVSNLVSRLIVRLAVPLYFIFSGYLFYNNACPFTAEGYRLKLQRRTKSLILPYVFWNLEVLFIYFLAQTFLTPLISGDSILVKDYSFRDWILAFWTPICGQLWYVRDLFLMIVLSPVIYYLIKKIPVAFIGVIGIIWVLGYRHEPTAFCTTSLFFFSLGALFPIRSYDLMSLVDRYKHFCYYLTLLYLLIIMVFYNIRDLYSISQNEIIFDIGILFLIVSALGISDFLVQKGKFKSNDFLSKSSFFIYAFHAMPLALFIKLFVFVFQPISDVQALLIYILAPSITIAFGLLLFAIIKKISPKFTSLITGYRG